MALSTSVQKACRLMRVLSDQRNTRLTDLASAAGIDKASALRLLETLVAEGFVTRDEASKAYSVGPEWMVLRATGVHRIDLRAVVRPALIRLAQSSEDSVILSVSSGYESVCMEMRPGTFPIRANYLNVGSRRPLGVGAGSLALLAALPDAEVDATLAAIGPSLKRYPHFSLPMLRREVEATRSRGYAMLLDVVVERMGGIAVPLHDPDGYPIGAISIAALSDRISDREEKLALALRREARAVSEAWLKSGVSGGREPSVAKRSPKTPAATSRDYSPA